MGKLGKIGERERSSVVLKLKKKKREIWFCDP